MVHLKELRTQKGYSQKELAAMLGISQPAYANYERGAREADYGTLSRLAGIFGVSVDYLLGRGTSDKFPSEDLTYMEVIGSVKAGYNGIAQEEHTGETTAIPTVFFKGNDKSEFFLLRVSGSSMYPQMIDGDLALVKKENSVDSGSVAVVLYGSEEATIKTVKYVNGENWVDLVPTNPEYETKRIEGSDLEKCRILGRVVKLIRDL